MLTNATPVPTPPCNVLTESTSHLPHSTSMQPQPEDELNQTQLWPDLMCCHVMTLLTSFCVRAAPAGG